MSPADIVATAEFRAGLYRRLAEVGLVPLEPAEASVVTLPDAPPKPADEARKAA